MPFFFFFSSYFLPHRVYFVFSRVPVKFIIVLLYFQSLLSRIFIRTRGCTPAVPEQFLYTISRLTAGGSTELKLSDGYNKHRNAAGGGGGSRGLIPIKMYKTAPIKVFLCLILDLVGALGRSFFNFPSSFRWVKHNNVHAIIVFRYRHKCCTIDNK